MTEPAKPVTASELLADTITVDDGPDKYTFKIPTLHDEIRIGAKMKQLCKDLDPNWDGFSFGFDGATQFSLRVCATFETLLKSATVTWPWTNAPNGAPVVDSSKFSADKVSIAMRVYQGFNDALASFREGRATS
jgi:hypothetical protein